MLTVAELIGVLQQCRGGERVVIRDAKGGVVDAVRALAVKIDLNKHGSGHHAVVTDEQGVPVALIEIAG